MTEMCEKRVSVASEACEESSSAVPETCETDVESPSDACAECTDSVASLPASATISVPEFASAAASSFGGFGSNSNLASTSILKYNPDPNFASTSTSGSALAPDPDSDPDPNPDPSPNPDPALLEMRSEGLTLASRDLELRGDFARLLPRLRPDRLGRELLVRAAKVKAASHRPFAVDATAGFGEDAFLLAAAGFTVQLFERNPTMAALLRDALRRASEDARLSEAAARMRLVEVDSIEALPQLLERPDVIVLDPMFPSKKKSAAARKKAQLLQSLERPCDDEEALLHAALAAHPRKVVVKRPLKGPSLAGVKPSYTLKGKSVRYDCIVLP